MQNFIAVQIARDYRKIYTQSQLMINQIPLFLRQILRLTPYYILNKLLKFSLQRQFWKFRFPIL